MKLTLSEVIGNILKYDKHMKELDSFYEVNNAYNNGANLTIKMINGNIGFFEKKRI